MRSWKPSCVVHEFKKCKFYRKKKEVTNVRVALSLCLLQNHWKTQELLDRMGRPVQLPFPCEACCGISGSKLAPPPQRAASRGMFLLFRARDSLSQRPHEQHMQNRSRVTRGSPGATGDTPSLGRLWDRRRPWQRAAELSQAGGSFGDRRVAKQFPVYLSLTFFSVNCGLYLLNCCFYQQFRGKPCPLPPRYAHSSSLEPAPPREDTAA